MPPSDPSSAAPPSGHDEPEERSRRATEVPDEAPLALGETTPGPLIMVVAFVGFVVLLGLFHPRSAAQTLDWKPTRSPELEAQNERLLHRPTSHAVPSSPAKPAPSLSEVMKACGDDPICGLRFKK